MVQNEMLDIDLHTRLDVMRSSGEELRKRGYPVELNVEVVDQGYEIHLVLKVPDDRSPIYG